MADRRMFSKFVVETDSFLDMPTTARELYFHLGMNADDDGFVANPRTIMRQVGASLDDVKVLAAKKFIFEFEDGVIVLRDWRVSNRQDADKRSATQYAQLLGMMLQDGQGRYYRTDDPETLELVSSNRVELYPIFNKTIKGETTTALLNLKRQNTWPDAVSFDELQRAIQSGNVANYLLASPLPQVGPNIAPTLPQDGPNIGPQYSVVKDSVVKGSLVQDNSIQDNSIQSSTRQSNPSPQIDINTQQDNTSPLEDKQIRSLLQSTDNNVTTASIKLQKMGVDTSTPALSEQMHRIQADIKRQNMTGAY